MQEIAWVRLSSKEVKSSDFYESEPPVSEKSARTVVTAMIAEGVE